MQTVGRDRVDVVLLRRVLAGSWRQNPPAPDFGVDELERITPALLAYNLAATAWWKIRPSSLAASATGRELAGIYRRQRIASLAHQQWISATVALLQNGGIDPMLVKGWAVALAYPQLGLRPLGDMDLCVRAEEFAAASAILSRNPGPRGMPVDLHQGFAKLDDRPADYLYAHSQQIRIGAVRVQVLSAEDHLRLLCVHALRHGVHHPKWLIDVAAVVENRPAGFDWARCLGRGKRAGWVETAVILAHKLLDADIAGTPFAGRAASLPQWISAGVLAGWADLLSPIDRLRREHPDLRPLVTYVRRPRGLLGSLRARWPDPIQATIRGEGSFARSAAYNQLRYSGRLGLAAARRFPAAWREEVRRERPASKAL